MNQLQFSKQIHTNIWFTTHDSVKRILTQSNIWSRKPFLQGSESEISVPGAHLAAEVND